MAQAQPPAPIKTPCVLVCAIDDDSGLCLGCFRTLDEVAKWGRLTADQRDQIMAQLPSRKTRIAPEKLGAA